MVKKNNYIVYLFIVLMLLASCSTNNNIKNEEQLNDYTPIILNNNLSTSGIHISLPNFWTIDKHINESGILFSSTSDDDSSLSVEKITPNFIYDIQKMVSFYGEYIFSPKETKITKFDEVKIGEQYIISGNENSKNHHTMIWFYKTSIYFFNYIFPEKVPNELSLISNISKTFFEQNPSISIRENYGDFNFISYNGKWQWVSDFNDGFFIVNTGEINISDDDLIVGIWSYQTKDEIFSYENNNFNISIESRYIYLNNRKLLVDIIGSKDSNGYIKLYLTFQLLAKNYCIYISSNSKTISLEGLLEHPEFKNLLNYNLFLNKGAD
ncbi:MAG: hypothetical protein OCD02_09580 [Spirochaetaceae bacterium]